MHHGISASDRQVIDGLRVHSIPKVNEGVDSGAPQILRYNYIQVIHVVVYNLLPQLLVTLLLRFKHALEFIHNYPLLLVKQMQVIRSP